MVTNYNFNWGVNKNIHINIYTDMDFMFTQKYLHFVSTFFESLEKITPLNKDFCITIECKFFSYTQQIVFNSFLENEGYKNFYPETYYNENDNAHLLYYSTSFLFERAFKRFHFLNVLFSYYHYGYNNNRNMQGKRYFDYALYDIHKGLFEDTEDNLKKYFKKSDVENYHIKGLEYDIENEGYNFSKILWSDNSFYSFIVQNTEQ